MDRRRSFKLVPIQRSNSKCSGSPAGLLGGASRPKRAFSTGRRDDRYAALSGSWQHRTSEVQFSHEEVDDVRIAYNHAQRLVERTALIIWWGTSKI